nr:hypothetical protein 3 [Moraxellaceae bacterium]
MSEISENRSPIQEWLDKWAGFRSKYKTKSVMVTGKTGSSSRRVRRSVKWRNFSTQGIRKELVRDLGELYESASGICKIESLETSEREKFFRICGYLAQNINTLTKSYDNIKIEESIKNLEKYVRENIEA